MPCSIAAAQLEVKGVEIPYHFRCPVSLELMRDPVTVSTGQTYNRSSIESWLATGNTTCPVTRAPLEDFSLIPNHTLRRLIQDWCIANRSLGVERIPTPKQPADATLVRSLVAHSCSSSASVEFRLAALRRLRSLSRDSQKNRLLISEFKSKIVNLAFNVEDCLALEALAVASVLKLSEEESSAVASRPDRIVLLSELMKPHNPIDVRINATVMIEAVSSGSRSTELRFLIASTDGIMEGIMEIITENDTREASKASVKALFSLCLVKQSIDIAVRCGAPEGLMHLIKVGDLDRRVLERALATVELLCRTEAGRDALVRTGDLAVVGTMVKVMADRESDRAAEHAVGVLFEACAASETVQKESVRRGVVPLLLLMVQGGCTERAKRKAKLLLKLLWSSALARQYHSLVVNSDGFQVLRQPITVLRY